jgi:septum formation topological specificity factor MinE
MSNSIPYDFGLLGDSTFPTSAPTGLLAGFNPNYSGLMPGATSSSGFDWSQLSGMNPNLLGYLKYTDWNNQQQNSAQSLKERLEVLEPMFQRRAEQQMKYGMMSNLAASFLKDIPAAIKNYAYAGREYDPARIQIASRSQMPDYIPDLRPNMPSRDYFSFARAR